MYLPCLQPGLSRVFHRDCQELRHSCQDEVSEDNMASVVDVCNEITEGTLGDAAGRVALICCERDRSRCHLVHSLAQLLLLLLLLLLLSY